MAMLSTVLQSKRAVKVNIEIMRAFVGLRRMLTSNEELARKLAALERNYDAQFKVSLMRFENSWRHQLQSAEKSYANGVANGVRSCFLILLKNLKNASTRLSMNGESPKILTTPPFILRFSKDERKVFQQNRILTIRRLWASNSRHSIQQ
jgi:hypothetical protein